ncbi:hypothetical protein KJ972_03885, partial [Candidatus Micrarchaeota archaeon]|nr:hypothetical protein [Candidatus Micrarchaeota archaeon]
LVPTWAGKGDGASKYYLHQGKADSTLALREQLANVSVAKGFRVFKKPIFSTSAILAETKGMIRNWSKKGFFGVDLETAATFAIAKHFGVACAGLLFLSDNVIEDQHVLMELAFEDKKRKIKAKESILPLALQSGIEFVKGV